MTINSPHPPKTVKKVTFTFSPANRDNLSIGPPKTVKKVTFSLPKRDTSSDAIPPEAAVKKVVSCLRFIEKVGLRSVADDDHLMMLYDFLKTLRSYKRGSIDKKAVEAMLRDVFRNHRDLFAQFRHEFIGVPFPDSTSSRPGRGYNLRPVKRRKWTK